jgi:PD-(D/E)XK endonuclease
MSTAVRGNEAEAMVLGALVQRGFDVLVPFGGGHSYDLVVDLVGLGFLRVQCKTAWPHGGCLAFNARTTDHGRGRQSYDGVADIFGVYFPPLRSVYLVPLDAVAGFQGRLRLEPTRNNQKRGVKFAANFEIEHWGLDALREVAHGMRAVEGARSFA